MKILFLCGSIEPGKDGVGDYTRRLACSLINAGHKATILSLCDKEAIKFIEEEQVIEKTRITVNRIPMHTNYNKRLAYVENIIKNIKPHWISLQYVPYSFNKKGLPLWMPKFLKQNNGNHQWHIMFHELWLGIDKESSFKHFLIGKLQQIIVKTILGFLKVEVIHTQSSHSKYILKNKKINARLLPLFSNIPLTKAVTKIKMNYTKFVIFGKIHPGAPFEEFIKNLIANIPKQDLKDLHFTFIGSNGILLKKYIKILEKYRIAYFVYGIQSSKIIADVLVDINWGISTTPFLQSEKSGVVAAYREHGLSVISVSRKWTPKIGAHIEPKNIVVFPRDKINFNSISQNRLDLSEISKIFLKSLVRP